MMGIKLQFLSWWTPEWFLKRGLDELAYSTIKGLKTLLSNESKSSTPLNGFNNLEGLNHPNIVLKGNLHEKRKSMATTHNQLVKTMINNLGYGKAVQLGRESMFREGLLLGGKFRKMLGVGNSWEDLLAAAKILYKILGIEFTIEETEDNGMIMRVNHCSLAANYTANTCTVLSAADEGVVQGLNPQIKMKFTERITEGAPCCLADLKLRGEEK